jgi:hypothetical protein
MIFGIIWAAELHADGVVCGQGGLVSQNLGALVHEGAGDNHEIDIRLTLAGGSKFNHNGV